MAKYNYDNMKKIRADQKKRAEARAMTGGLGDANASADTIQKGKVRLKDSMKKPTKDEKKTTKTKTSKTVSDKMKNMYTKNIKDKLDKKVKEEVTKANKSPKTIARKDEKAYKDTKKTASDKIGKTKKYSALDNSMSEKFSKTMSKIKKDSGEPRTVAAAQKAGKLYFTDKNGNKKIAVTAAQLKKSGMSLTKWINTQKKKGGK